MEAAASKAATVEEAQKRKEKQTVEKRKLTAVDSSVDSTASPTGERSSKKPATATSAGAAASAAPAVASQLSLEDQVRAADTTATQAAVLLDAPGNWSMTPDVVAMVMGRKIQLQAATSKMYFAWGRVIERFEAAISLCNASKKMHEIVTALSQNGRDALINARELAVNAADDCGTAFSQAREAVVALGHEAVLHATHREDWVVIQTSKQGQIGAETKTQQARWRDCRGGAQVEVSVTAARRAIEAMLQAATDHVKQHDTKTT
jgi:hypothetical protein